MPVLPLTAVGLRSTDRVGRKAAVLGDLMAAGFPVPDGHVVTADALGQALRANGLDDHASSDQVREAALPEDLSEALRRVAAEYGDVPLAVRSSATAEDLGDRSFAGQYESILGVVGAEALIEAVSAGWSSAFTARVDVYQRARGLGGSRRMAVLIQRMVPAAAAGVAFSANPVTGARDEVVISAVAGLGDALVSGAVTPDEWSVRGDAATCVSAAGEAIDAALAVQVAELARRAAGHYGEPQDIEWATDGDMLWLLQSRPITALPEPAPEPVPIPVEVPDGLWSRVSHWSTPISPLQRSLALPVLNASTGQMLAYGLAERIEFREIGGWVYISFTVPTRPEAIEAKLREIARKAERDEPGSIIAEWYESRQPDLDLRLSGLRGCALAEMGDDELIDHVRQARTLAAEAQELHFRTAGAAQFVWGEFGLACERLLGWTPVQVLQLLVGLPGKTTEPTFRLSELARLAAGLPDDGWSADLAFAKAFDRYLHEYGHRTLGADLTQPTLAEQPELVTRLIRDQLATGYDPRAEMSHQQASRDAALAEARARPAGGTEQFDRLLGRAQRAYPIRDDGAYYANAAWAMVRRGMLELGRRLAARGLLDTGDHVFFLEWDEAIAVLKAGSPVGELVTRRRGMRAWAEQHPGPPVHGAFPVGAGDGQPHLTEELRHASEVAGWVWQATRTDNVPVGGQDGLRGIGASPGRYTGVVRVITSEAEFGRLRLGDVLVCPETTPQWAVLFPSVGALVTDTGGLLSHPAIIAREYRVPAVLATREATVRLRDGETVTVDGNAGTVERS
ncbi:PEP/pyruvate-binding domain-containing protein [Nonomuraea sp. NPDC051941]|uniref:PEP/pyruvate-binding domain-containing protein n=1 Tax=Nonomuraea sp. NPDC051941 TaxID=3364373 RepID=UPI0037C7F88E